MTRTNNKKFYPTLSDARAAVKLLNINTSKEYLTKHQLDPRLPADPSRFYELEWQDWYHFIDKDKPDFYSTLEEVRNAAQKLNIRNRYEYAAKYKINPRLPSNPSRFYAAEWQDWHHFFGREKTDYYMFSEAITAVRRLNINSKKEFYAEYKKDPRLPGDPAKFYAHEWQSWYHFFGKVKPDFYTDITEASSAVQRMNISSIQEYIARHKEDPLLPSNPSITYASEWTDWYAFLGKVKVEFYNTLAEARAAVQRLNIRSSDEYSARYSEDPRLPSHPSNTYAHEWKDRYHFFGKSKPNYYARFADAIVAVRRLNIKTQREFYAKRREDSKLSRDPSKFYAAEWQGWPHFLGKEKPELYATIAEASAAVKRLNINTQKEFFAKYTEDPRLTSRPAILYASEWKNWYHFFGKDKPTFYKTLGEASTAVRRLNIRSKTEFLARSREDPLLSRDPCNFYASEWQDWYHFLGTKRPSFYTTYARARKAALHLKIKNLEEYRVKYKEDPLLPSHPSSTYVDEWRDWDHFLGKVKPKPEYYATLAEACAAVRLLNINTMQEYRSKYKEDPRLPLCPSKTYSQEWIDLDYFLGKNKPRYYNTLSEASSAALLININTQKKFFKRYKEDPLLPREPAKVYAHEWQDWPHFFGKAQPVYYETLSEASIATQKLMIYSKTEYKKRHKSDSRLPTLPDNFYSSAWISWLNFLLPHKINTLEQLKIACKVLQIRDSPQYRAVRREYKMLPAHPERLLGWRNWYDLLDIPVPYTYQELVKLVRKAGCQTLESYKKFRSEERDPRIPASPIETYEQSGWTNTFDFFGKPRPFQVKYLETEWQLWGDCITRFLKQARGSGSKAQELCEFVRRYIQAEEYETSPHEFLTRTKTNTKPLVDLLNQHQVHKKKRKLHSINEFLEWIIQTDLTIEDETSGEIIRLKNAVNPFKYLNFDNEQYAPPLSETAKPSLPYQFVKAGRDWIFPPNSVLTSLPYSELSHLLKFSADWITLDDTSKVDLNDPDCVTKTERGKVLLWVPTFWTYTYALMQLPARGMQIVYCDSGEMDEETPYFEKGQLLWKRNESPQRGQTKRQGMIYKTENNDFGVHYTSNKTQLFGEGYDIPYMPLELAYWLIKLRNWQQKYNPISKPKPWLDCKRTNLNENQRKSKGANCFLFREFGDEEPGTFGGRLADRLAASLFFSVKDEAALSTYRDCSFKDVGEQVQQEPNIVLSQFSSSFTPHTMRVSLINAYAFEFGLPIEVIMKLVGHASIVMSVYYLKSGLVRQKIELGEKQAFLNAQVNARRFIEEHGIEEYRNQLTANNPEILQSLNNANSEVVYLWKDFGFCPVGGNSCNSGGEPVAVGANAYHPVPAGYIGEQNCIRCKFFVTGPAFLMGLAALYNEITLALSAQTSRNSELLEELTEVGRKIDVISHEQYENQKNASKNQQLHDHKEQLKTLRRKLNSEIETRSKKVDMLLTDLNYLYRHVQNSKALTDMITTTGDTSVKLIVPNLVQFDVELEESTQFRILSEVCENAELFHSCSSELAVAKRSQALDRFMIKNDLPPQLMFLDEHEQVVVGNQLTRLMYARIHSWETIDRLIAGDLTIKDLDSEIHLTSKDINKLFAEAKPIPIKGLT